MLLGSTGESWRCICSVVMIFQNQIVQDHGHYTKTRALELTTVASIGMAVEHPLHAMPFIFLLGHVTSPVTQRIYI